MKGFQKKFEVQTDLPTDKVIHRGAPLLKNLFFTIVDCGLDL